jgi:hypothetical protein
VNHLPGDDDDSYPAYTAVIETAIADWTKRQADPLPIPMSEPALGALARIITERLVAAGFIDQLARPDDA